MFVLVRRLKCPTVTNLIGRQRYKVLCNSRLLEGNTRTLYHQSLSHSEGQHALKLCQTMKSNTSTYTLDVITTCTYQHVKCLRWLSWQLWLKSALNSQWHNRYVSLAGPMSTLCVCMCTHHSWLCICGYTSIALFSGSYVFMTKTRTVPYLSPWAALTAV